MILYKYSADCSKMELGNKKQDNNEYARFYSYQSPITALNNKFYTIYSVEKKVRVVISKVWDDKMTLVAVQKMEADAEECEKIIKKHLPEIDILKREEITSEEFGKELTRAERNDWIERSKDSIFRELQMTIAPCNYGLFDGVPYKVSESVYSEHEMSKQTCENYLRDILASEDFYEEIDRIYSNENEHRFVGHPVHYLITAGDKKAADDMIDVLIPALLKNKRLLSGRVCYVENIQPKAKHEEGFFNIFSAFEGGTVVINLAGENDLGMYATGYHELAEELGQKLGEYGNNTLFIFVDVSGKRTIANETIAAILCHADMIQIKEGYGDLKRAEAYLKRLAEKTEYTDYKVEDLTQYLPEDREIYSVSDIFTAYNQWYGRGLKTHIYKAYKEKDIIRIELKKKMDQPYVELQKMVGLSDVKKVTDEILAAAKMQKMRKEMGLPETKASMHMLFSGNPGSAKTTVARLLAQILKEEGVLSNGHLVECGRQDLVGKYVGWTAKIVEEKFKAARGGILFIDEAYSLVEDGKTYGAEAINTIVQQMENYREEVIVIFAGYPEKMSEFLEQNEGLASRIAFHLKFPDYTAQELVRIMDLMLEKQGYQINDQYTREKCLAICAQVCTEKNYGNGRFVRNMLEQAMMKQADRLLRGSGNLELSKEEASKLIAEDFEMPEERKTQNRRIGFVVC